MTISQAVQIHKTFAKKEINMKRTVFAIVSFMFAVCMLQGCGPAKNGDGMFYNPSMGYYDEAEAPSYSYDEVKENGFTVAAVKNSSTFSLDRNTTGYSIARRQINGGMKISADSVRVEEYVNYFSYSYPEPTDGKPLAISGKLFDCPWNAENKLFTVGVSAKQIDFTDKKQNNLVFLIDVSGSMFGSDRLGLIQNAFTMLANNLADNDVVSIVTYAGSTKVVAEGLNGTQKSQICNVLQDLSASGSTAGASGIQLAYKVAEKYFIQGGNNRVMLATDGDFNVGISNKNQLNEFISAKRDTGIYLSVFGVGMGNTRDDIMETLAKNGNGNYGYLDSITEARKLLVSEMGGTLETVAKDAKINVTFNADKVEKFRLIGYENKMMSEDDFNDENKDAGEIGSGHTVTAVYEIKLKDGTAENAGNETLAEFASVKIKCKDPDSNENIEIDKSFDLDLYMATPDEDGAFIASVTEFGLLLRESQYKGTASWQGLLSRLTNLTSVNGANADEFRAEFLELVKKAQTIYSAQ